jgi:chemotaxis protein histidine kinase CheA
MSANKNTILKELIDQLSESIPGKNEFDDSYSLQKILANIEALGLAAGENERLGFQDVCLLVQETFSDLIENKNSLDNNQYESLKLWQVLASNYLMDSKASTANALIDFFKRPELNSSIEIDDLDVLKDMLGEEAKQFKILFSPVIKSLKDNTLIDTTVLHDKLEQLSKAESDNNQTGFVDICLLLQENILEIEHNQKTLNNAQKDLFLNWLNQAELFLSDADNAENASLLINILKDQEWPTPLTDVDANILLGMFGIQPSEIDSSEIPEALVDLYNKLLNSTSKISPDNRDTILNIANDTEEIGLAAGELELLGFQDICLIIKENLTDMMSDESLAIQDYVTHISQWPELVKNYITEPDNTEASQNILDYLTNQRWPNPLEETDLDILKDMMGIKDQTTDVMDTTMVATPDQMDSTIVTTNEHVQGVLSEILDDVIDTKDILAAPRTISKDLVDMLREEVVMIQEEVKDHIETIRDENIEAEIIADSLSQYALHIERFGSACQAAELDGLHQVSSVFANNLNYFAGNKSRLSDHQLTLISSWPDKVSSYLQEPGSDTYSNELAVILQDESLPKNLMKGVLPALINLLKAVYVSDKDISKETRQTVATAEDVSIELPEDINQELLDGLLQELPGQTESFSASIQALIDGSGDISEVQKAQRVAHTVKGAANTVGVKGIAVLTHQLEDIMSSLSDLNRLPSSTLATVFMDAADCLEEMSEALLERGSAPVQSQEVLQSVLDWANRIESEGASCLDEQGEANVQVNAKAKDTISEEKSDEETTSEATLRVPAKLIDEVLRLLGETTIVTSQLQERVRLSTLQSQRLIEHQNMVQHLTSDLEVQVDVNSSVYGHKQAVNQNEVFDSLELEEYNELHTVTHQIVEASVDSFELNQEIADDLHELDELLIEKSRLHHEIQELIMRTRMVPIKSIAPRLQRIVRQTCRTTKKQAALEIIGSDTLIDSDILNKLVDPLMHMLRNAVDHGIETREERIHLKKEAEGKLQLSFFREGTQIVVRCKDDGAGLNHQVILEKAIKQNLVKAEEKLSENDINRLILHPGFSTRETSTQTSGRGVGMDIIHTELLALKGSVHIESEPNKGCLIELRMPVTLMSSHALLLRHLNQIIAVSNHGIEKILHPSDSQIIKEDDAMYCEVDGEKLQMMTLESLLNLPSDRRHDDRETRPALLIREEELNHVIYIQEIVDTSDLFVKSMGKYLNNIKGMLGATILGDGSVVPVIDLPELIRAPVSHTHSPSELTQTNIHRALPIALVVDDSLSARRALAQVIQDAGFDVRTAKDGLEAVGIVENKKPDIMLVDMEMPRMNGMELTSHIRGFENTKDIPVIMVTSRSTEKHRKQATAAGVDIYITKPFSEDELLDHVHDLLN